MGSVCTAEVCHAEGPTKTVKPSLHEYPYKTDTSIIIIIIIIIKIIITLLISSKRLFSLIYNVKYLKLSFPKIPLKMLFYFNFKYI